MYFPFLWNNARVKIDIEEVAERIGKDISTLFNDERGLSCHIQLL